MYRIRQQRQRNQEKKLHPKQRRPAAVPSRNPEAKIRTTPVAITELNGTDTHSDSVGKTGSPLPTCGINQKSTEEKVDRASGNWPHGGAGPLQNGLPEVSNNGSHHDGDEELLARAFAAKNSEKFKQLWEGEWEEVSSKTGTRCYKSKIDAIRALCMILAYWTGKDANGIDRLFRRSRLYDAKWEGKEYRDLIVKEAIAQTSKTYTPKATGGKQSTGAEKKNAEGGDKDRTKFVEEPDGLWGIVQQYKGPKKIWICSPIKVIAFARGTDGGNWGRVVEWRDPDGKSHQMIIAMEDLSGDGAPFRSEMLSRGFRANSRREGRDLLFDYLQTQAPKLRILCTTKLGWHDNTFVFAEGSIPGNVFYQGNAKEQALTNVSGSLEEWRDHVSLKCQTNSRLIFALSIAFAAPMLPLLQQEGGGFNFVGPSSIGKTTLLRVSGSVYGGGGKDGFVRSWRLTRNGAEPLAELHNHGLLLLDELAQLEPFEAADVAYLLANGQGKHRMGKGIVAQRQPTWTLLFISSGEITLGEHVETCGKKVRAGQQIRMIDIPADAGCGNGIFEIVPEGMEAAAFSDLLSNASRQFYGRAIREFIRCITHDRDGAIRAIEEIIKRFRADCLPKGAAPEVVRGLGRFALVGAAGELATSFEITGWEAGEAIKAANTCFKAWLGSRETIGSADEHAAVKQVKEFIERHGESRFGRESDFDRIITNRAGYIRRNEDTSKVEYLFLPEVFRREVCKGFNPSMVLHALNSAKLLVLQKGSHLTVKREIEGSPTTRFYCVSMTDDLEQD
jgi:putative DNA primase/helicase